MKREMLIPAAIVFVGLILAIAVYNLHHTIAVQQNGNPSAVNPVNPSVDHILGDPNAPVIVIEYADIDSEFSKDFQQVMEQIMQEYGSTGKVAWVYREFPLVTVDQYSEQHAEAAECVASIGNTNDFFSFIDALQAAAPGDNQFNPSGYDAVVTSLGLSSGSFDQCMTAHTFRNKVATDLANAGAIGATGAPSSVVLVKGQKPFIILGGLPYAAMKQVIDTSLAKTGAN
jgi:protein-disulfide isomerase